MNRLLTAALLSLSVVPVWAGDRMEASEMPAYGQWRSSMIGGGGYIQNVVLTADPKRLYSYVDVGGFYRSDDAGRHWRMMHGNLPNKQGKTEVRGLLADPRNPDRILVACGSSWASEPMGVFASDDGGRTLKPVLSTWYGGNADSRWDGFVLDRDPKNPDVIITATFGSGLHRSADNGATWTSSPGTDGFFFTDIRFDRHDPSRAYACALQWKGWLGGKQQALKPGFFTSSDGGKAWQKISDASPREIVQDPKLPRLYGIFDGGASIRISDDGGKTWADLHDGLAINPEAAMKGHTNRFRYNAMAAGPDFVLIADTVGTFYRLPSGGKTWEKIAREGINYRGWFGANKGMFGQALGSITVDPRDPDHWFFTDWFSIYETTDAGKHWTLQMDGVEVTVIHTICQDPSDPGRVHMGMADDGYFQSENGGASFDSYKVSGNTKDVALSPKLPARVYAAATATWEWYSNQVFVSIDGGKKWQRSPMTGLPDMKTARCNWIAVNPEDPYDVYLTVSGELKPNGGGPYRSSDGGKTWTWAGGGLPQNAEFYTADIWNAGRKIAAGPGGTVMTFSRSAGLFRYDVTAQSWNRVADAGGAIGIVADPFTKGRFLVTGDSGVTVISDNGAKVDRTLTTRATHIAADQAKPGRFAVSVHDGVMLSTDGGTTWTMLDTALPHPLASNPLGFAGERLVAGSGGSGVFWIPLSPEGQKPIAAKPLAPVPAVRAGAAPVGEPLRLSFDAAPGTDLPAGWNTPWVGQGKVIAVRDTQIGHNGKASIRIQTDAPGSYGTVSQPVRGTTPFTLHGFGKIEGQVEECLVAVQCFDAEGKQVAWVHVANLAGAKDWEGFSADVSLGANVRTANLVFTIRGTGKAWLSDLRADAPTPVFP